MMPQMKTAVVFDDDQPVGQDGKMKGRKIEFFSNKCFFL